MLLTILIILVAIIIFIAAFVLARTSMFLRPIEPVEPVELPEVNPELIAGHLAATIRCKTVSLGENIPQDRAAFRELHDALEALYPRVHATLTKEIISDYSLLYTWKGSNPELRPVLFCAHQDVVPADPGTLDQWDHDPFSGDIADGYVWGRGSLDIKVQMIGVLDAVEYLIKHDFKPERTVYLGFGQDEEIGGMNGAAKIAEFLSGRGEQLEAVLDEGGAIMEGTLPGLLSPAAMVGVAEKGYLSVILRVTQTPGHSSTPPASSAIGILSRAIQQVEDHPLPTNLNPIRETYRQLGPAVSTGLQMIFANLWLFGGILRRRMQATGQTNAAIRTTTAVTMISGGIKDNILPQKAEAVVNLRLMPGDTIADVCEYLRNVIDDENVELEAIAESAWEASPWSSVDGEAFLSLGRCIRQVFPGTEVAPYLVYGATDARYYAPLSDQVFRFLPLQLEGEDLHRMHGINERVEVDSLGHMVQFFIHLMQVWAGETGEADIPAVEDAGEEVPLEE